MTTVKVDFSGLNKLENIFDKEKAQRHLANELVMISDNYAPFRDGYLKNSVQIANDGSYITYGTFGQSKTYARKLWYGDEMNFREAPIRGSRWVTRAFNDNVGAINRSLQNAQNRGLFR